MNSWLRAIERAILESDDASLEPTAPVGQGERVIGTVNDTFNRKTYVRLHWLSNELDRISDALAAADPDDEEKLVRSFYQLHQEMSLIHEAFTYGLFEELKVSTCPDVWLLAQNAEFQVRKDWQVTIVQTSPDEEEEPAGDLVLLPSKEALDKATDKPTNKRKKMH